MRGQKKRNKKEKSPSKEEPPMNIPRFSLKQIRKRCQMPVADFSSEVNWTIESKDGPLLFKDNGADVLAIAHLDSVTNDTLFEVRKNKDHLAYVTAPQLDDRLGVYVIMDLLPLLGVKTDLLLTTGEESGRSTAQHFATTKQYKWMFSFDRKEISTVLYSYDCPELRALLKDAGCQIEYGSVSDISYLRHLKCAGVNFGVGYQDYHSRNAHFFLCDLKLQIERFMKFWNVNQSVVLPYADPKTLTRTYNYNYSSRWTGFTAWDGENEWGQGDSDWRQGRIWDYEQKKYVQKEKPQEKKDEKPHSLTICDNCYQDSSVLNMIRVSSAFWWVCPKCKVELQAEMDDDEEPCDYCSIEHPWHALLPVVVIFKQGEDDPCAMTICKDCEAKLRADETVLSITVDDEDEVDMPSVTTSVLGMTEAEWNKQQGEHDDED